MVKRDELTKFIHESIGEELLEKVQELDNYANGVQIHGKEEVKKIVLGVSASLDFFKEAVKAKADYCAFHHGLDLTNNNIINCRLHPGTEKRLKMVFENNLTVAGFHAALDMQPEFGNNAMIIKLLGAKRLRIPYSSEWGYIGEFDTPQETKKLAGKLSEILNHDVMAIYGGPKKVKRIGVCSGAAKPYGKEIWEIIDKSVELHISGEIAEAGPSMAKDMGFNYMAGGHYASEVFGVQELGKIIKRNYQNKLEVEFIDIPNPV